MRRRIDRVTPLGEVDRGQVIFFRNTGSATIPFFVRQSDADNPLKFFYGNEGAPRDLPRFAARFGVQVVDGRTPRAAFDRLKVLWAKP